MGHIIRERVSGISHGLAPGLEGLPDVCPLAHTAIGEPLLTSEWSVDYHTIRSHRVGVSGHRVASHRVRGSHLIRDRPEGGTV